jgi:hypothetical protein
MHEGIEGLTRDKTLAYCTAADRDRRSGGRTDEPSAAPRGDPLEPPGNGQGGWGSAGPRCGASGQGKGFSGIGCARPRSPTTPNSPTSSRRSLASTSIHRPMLFVVGCIALTHILSITRPIVTEICSVSPNGARADPAKHKNSVALLGS